MPRIVIASACFLLAASGLSALSFDFKAGLADKPLLAPLQAGAEAVMALVKETEEK